MNLEDLVIKTDKLKVLYVEDNDNTRKQTLEMLSNFFEYIDIAKDGREGLQKYQNKEENFYDLIISDISMPNMSGIEMLKAILKINNEQNIIVVTAYNTTEYLQELINIGIHSYIQKPIKLDALMYEFSKVVESIEKRKEEEKEFTKIVSLNHELDALVESFDTYVIASRTDLKGVITYASKAYEIISGYSEAELIGKPHSIVRHPDMPASAFKDMWSIIKAEKLWIGEVKNLKKDGSFYWVNAFVAPYYNSNREHIGYSAIRIDITSKKRAEKLNNEITNLLNNTDQGFLSFNKNFIIDESFSRECLNLFDTTDIANKNITNILFVNDDVKKDLFEDAINRVIQTDDDMSKELFLSLLPKKHTIGDKIIEIAYRLLPNDKFMLIITDITHTKTLELKIKKQNQIQKMIVAIVSNKNDFIEIRLEFENFLSNLPSDITLLLRELHTFKGLFAQKEMVNIVTSIHNLETTLKELNQKSSENINKIFQTYDLQSVFLQDIEIVSSILGSSFLEEKATLKIDTHAVDLLEQKLQLVTSENITESLENILKELDKFRYESVFKMLQSYPSSVKLIAQKLQKDIYPFEIEGNKNLKIHSKYKSFMRSLIHLFNNCVEHGIEDIETRIVNNKDEMGTVLCKYVEHENNLQIVISDDGAGINIEKLTITALKKSIKTQEELASMNDDEKAYLIFADNLSTNEEISTTSGRGVGMSAILSELNKFDGNIKINNNVGKGVEFIFTIPL